MSLDVDRWVRKVRDATLPERVAEARERMAAAWNLRPVDRPPLSITCPPPEPWPTFEYSETFKDADKMLVSQLASAYSHCLLEDDGILCVRANYGVGVIPSGFGSQIVVPEGANQMPWVKEPIIRSDPPSAAELRVPNPCEDGLMGKVLDTEEYFVRKLDGTGVSVYLCDTQGPLDVAYLIRGAKLFKDFYLYPDFVRDLLGEVSRGYVDFSEIQKRVVGEPTGQAAHGTPNVWMAKGGTRLCEDVAVMLRPELYREFCTPANELCLGQFDGGMGHFCSSESSTGKHILNSVLSTTFLRAFFFGSPSRFYNLHETVKLFREKQVCLIWTDGPPPDQKPEDWVSSVVRGLDDKTGVIFSISVQDFSSAREISNLWRKSFD